MKICNQCGMQLEDSAVFCNRCGYQFAVYTQSPYVQQDIYQNGGMPQTQTKKTGPTGMSIAAFILSFFIPPVALILGIVDLAKKSGHKKGLSIAAVILSSIGLLWSLLLIGTMTPQLIIYIEKTNVSADTQLCGAIRTAITTAMIDPDVIVNDSATISIYSDGNWYNVSALGGGSGSNTFRGAIKEIIGFDPYEIESHINSSYKGGKASGMMFRINGNQVEVKIENSDSSGKKGAYGSDPIYVYQ